MKPSYIKLFESGELDQRIDSLYRIVENCELCPRKCHINRTGGETGYCRTGAQAVVSSMHPHFGEEDPLVGAERFPGVGGSGTIFMTYCNLGCVYCQNYDISHLGHGRAMGIGDLAAGMMGLQKQGCYNINFVTPTHFVPQIAGAVKLAALQGLNLPLVYNCGGYENPETVRLLEGIFDIFMPDIKYSDERISRLYSNVPDYFARCREAVREMHRQVGDLKLDSRGIAEKGLLIRHLVLPNDLAGSEEILRFLAEEISPHTYVNIMRQYRPAFKASEFSELNRRPAGVEFQKVFEKARELGLHRGF